MNLTGKTRYRTSWLGKMILQVQLANVAGTWRDATLNDFCLGEIRKDDLVGHKPPFARHATPMPLVKPPKPT